MRRRRQSMMQRGMKTAWRRGSRRQQRCQGVSRRQQRCQGVSRRQQRCQGVSSRQQSRVSRRQQNRGRCQGVSSRQLSMMRIQHGLMRVT
jgi:hypothetical protein